MQIVSSKIRNAIYNTGEKIYIHELTRKWGLFRGKKKKKNLKNNQFPILVMWETKDQLKSLMPLRSLLGELGLHSGWGRLEIKPCPKDQKLPWCKYLQSPSCLKMKYFTRYIQGPTSLQHSVLKALPVQSGHKKKWFKNLEPRHKTQKWICIHKNSK